MNLFDRSLGRTGKTAAVSLVFAVAVIAALAAPAGATVQTEARASARAEAGPIVLSVQVRNRSVPYTGGVAHFTVKIRRVSTCKLEVAGTPDVVVAFSGAWQRCSNGIFHHAVRLGGNSEQTARNVAFRVYLRRGTETYRYPLGSVRVAGAPPAPSPPPAAPPVPTASLTISTSALTSAGGPIALSYSSANASTCSLSSSPTFWTGNNPATVNCSGTYSATIASSSVERQWTFTFTATSTEGQSANSVQTLEQLAPSPSSFVQSLNWSGYVVPSSSALITDASGQWTVPTLDCANTPNAGEFTWVGTGGAGSSSGDLLQTGVGDDCVDGVQQDFGWWEEVPNSPNSEVTFARFPVSPGDSIEAFVFQITSDCSTNCGQWETELEDLHTGLAGFMVTGEGWGVASIGSGTFPYQGTTTDLAYSGGYTAEWIVEDYEFDGSWAPFANYGTVNFSDLQLGGLSPWYLTASEGLEIVQDGVVLSTPSAPGNDSFSVSYTTP